MNGELSRADLLSVVERSPAAAAAHDRAGWVGLFAADGSVEDPVGSRPAVGHHQIGKFFDTFIGPRDIVFHRDADYVAGATVLRDVLLQVSMGGGVDMRIPAYLRYVVNGDHTIAELQAYWELPAMLWQFARQGVGAATAGAGLAVGLLRNQGPLGTLGFARGFRRPGRRDRALLDALLTAVSSGDQLTVHRMLGRGTPISAGDDGALGLEELSAVLRGATWSKRIGAGPTVAVGVRTADDSRGVLLVDFRSEGLPAITRLRWFC
ncbi:ketosteroid isomerase family protein [Mycolicibacterium fallax]|uniref:Nuclear transport factor 2 domain-containing protein n=1 Tax=Mycolicibacterium fallax TaxID=1793 RepID=A0A1X1RHD8_MYCFA|nr:ketosteroid isomerase family protein [Mycolicibacterium fallax]ORV06324.1 hypothetical protein AWC04_05655 [Mycolicibacterium fallax]BBY97652.1 hypothetical protein MFAL_11190 [Mycolicibacterium fallax]HOW94333.1 ketosteroid isomerase family protein [Mycolicibacterium fallax]